MLRTRTALFQQIDCATNTERFFPPILPGLQCWVLPSPKLSPDGAPSWGKNFEVYCGALLIPLFRLHPLLVAKRNAVPICHCCCLYPVSALTVRAPTTGPPTGVAVRSRSLGWNGDTMWTKHIMQLRDPEWGDKLVFKRLTRHYITFFSSLRRVLYLRTTWRNGKNNICNLPDIRNKRKNVSGGKFNLI